MELALGGIAAVGRAGAIVAGVLSTVRRTVARVRGIRGRGGSLVGISACRFRLSSAGLMCRIVVVVQLLIRSRCGEARARSESFKRFIRQLSRLSSPSTRHGDSRNARNPMGTPVALILSSGRPRRVRRPTERFLEYSEPVSGSIMCLMYGSLIPSGVKWVGLSESVYGDKIVVLPKQAAAAVAP